MAQPVEIVSTASSPTRWAWPIASTVLLDIVGYVALAVAAPFFEIVRSFWHISPLSGQLLRVLLFAPLAELVALPFARRYRRPWILVVVAVAFLASAFALAAWAVFAFRGMPVVFSPR